MLRIKKELIKNKILNKSIDDNIVLTSKNIKYKVFQRGYYGLTRKFI
jgi:hypothetical protein